MWNYWSVFLRRNIWGAGDFSKISIRALFNLISVFEMSFVLFIPPEFRPVALTAHWHYVPQSGSGSLHISEEQEAPRKSWKKCERNKLMSETRVTLIGASCHNENLLFIDNEFRTTPLFDVWITIWSKRKEIFHNIRLMWSICYLITFQLNFKGKKMADLWNTNIVLAWRNCNW